MFKALLIAAALAATTLAQAQAQARPAQAPAPAPAPKPTPAASSAAKKELVAKILQAQQPGFEMTARRVVEQPAIQMLQQASQVIQQRLPAEKREPTFREIAGRRAQVCRRHLPAGARSDDRTLAPPPSARCWSSA